MHGIIEIEQKTHYEINKFIETLKRKAASTNDSPSSLGENGANQRGSSSVKILSNISLPPYRPSLSSQNSSNTQQTSQGKQYTHPCTLPCTLPYFSLQIRVITLLKCISGGYDNSYVSHFYSSKNKAFGLNASPESAMSPSISSVATSASEVSTPIRFLLHFTLIFIKIELLTSDFHVFHYWNWCIYK